MDVEVLEDIFLVDERYFLIKNCILITKLCCIYKKYSYSLFKHIPEFPLSWQRFLETQFNEFYLCWNISVQVNFSFRGQWVPWIKFLNLISVFSSKVKFLYFLLLIT